MQMRGAAAWHLWACARMSSTKRAKQSEGHRVCAGAASCSVRLSPPPSPAQSFPRCTCTCSITTVRVLILNFHCQTSFDSRPAPAHHDIRFVLQSARPKGTTTREPRAVPQDLAGNVDCYGSSAAALHVQVRRACAHRISGGPTSWPSAASSCCCVMTPRSRLMAAMLAAHF